jgi:hypothetical protein
VMRDLYVVYGRVEEVSKAMNRTSRNKREPSFSGMKLFVLTDTFQILISDKLELIRDSVILNLWIEVGS